MISPVWRFLQFRFTTSDVCMWTSYLLYQEFFWGLVGIKKMIVWKIKIFWVKRKPMDSVLLINHCTQLFFLTKKKLISELNRWIYVYQIDKDGFHRHIKFWFFFFTWQFIIICKAMHSITVKKLNLCQIMLWMEHTFVFADF